MGSSRRPVPVQRSGIHTQIDILHQTVTMKTAILFLCVCLAYVTAAPQKRVFINDITGEAGKILKCEGEKHEEGCRVCCDNTKWYFDTEKTACNAACNILPDKADY